jgi:hypothetical protein
MRRYPVRYHGDPDPDEGDRLNREARFERMDEEAERRQEMMELSPLAKWCEAQPQEAAWRIEMLQESVNELAPLWHFHADHSAKFEDCLLATCKKLRARGTPINDFNMVTR